MLRKIDSENMGKGDLGWLKSNFHFSFAEYFNKNNMKFGVLRVLNDDIIEAKKGFPMHSHNDMEIISYVVKGQLTHEDNMGNKGILDRGDVQYMSSGTGIFHSEFNLGDETLRLLQIWILPDKKGHAPFYSDFKFTKDDRKNKWLNIVSSTKGSGHAKINQDANIFVIELEEGKKTTFEMLLRRQAYLVQIEGLGTVNKIQLKASDALEIHEEDINIEALKNSHYLLIEMNKE